jgi:fluoride ion exporter CrcB/FEX
MNSTQNQTAVENLPNGPAAAAILSAGFGCFILGVLAVLTDAFKPLAKLLTFYLPTGPLSGVSTMAILLWLAAWFILAACWRTKSVAIARTNALAFLFLTLGILLTFPPFADALQGK